MVDGIPWGYAVGAIQSLDPHTYKVTRTFHVDANPRQVSHPDVEATYGDGAFWAIVVADEDQTFGGSVVKIDAETGKVDRTYTPPDPGGYADIKFLDHAVWLKGDDSGRLVKLDTTTGRSRVYRLPGFEPLNSFYPMTMGVGMSDLWIRLSSAQVSRFDPVTGKVIARYPATRTQTADTPTCPMAHCGWRTSMLTPSGATRSADGDTARTRPLPQRGTLT